MANRERHPFPFLLVAEAGLILSIASSMLLHQYRYGGSGSPFFKIATSVWLAGAALSIICFLIATSRAKSQPAKVLNWFGACGAIAALLFGGPILVYGHSSNPKNSCINILRQIDGAKEQFALENKLSAGAPVTEKEIAQYIKGQSIPKCSDGGRYTLGKIDEPPRCSIAGHTI